MKLTPKMLEIIRKCNTIMFDELTDIKKDIYVNLAKKIRLRTKNALGRKRDIL